MNDFNDLMKTIFTTFLAVEIAVLFYVGRHYAKKWRWVFGVLAIFAYATYDLWCYR